MSLCSCLYEMLHQFCFVFYSSFHVLCHIDATVRLTDYLCIYVSTVHCNCNNMLLVVKISHSLKHTFYTVERRNIMH